MRLNIAVNFVGWVERPERVILLGFADIFNFVRSRQSPKLAEKRNPTF